MNRMITGLSTLAVLLLAPSASAQSMESIPFRVNMSTANEVPAIEGLVASGFGTVWVHVVRDAAGKVTSGTVDFTVRYQFPGEVTITGTHIHRGAAGINGPVLIDSRISAANPVVDATGRGEIVRTAQVPAGSANVAVIEDLLANPDGYYLNLHTSVNPGGAIRAQMTKAERRVFGGVMSPDNEVPPVASRASGMGFVTILASRNADGQLISSEATFDLSYSGFPEGTQFTGFHIHNGGNGVNAGVTIDSGLSRAQNVFAGAGGAGTLRYVIDVNVAAPAAVATVQGLFTDAGSGYWNLHTTVNAGGEIRTQLRGTERRSFVMNMLTSNEVPAITNLDASAVGMFEANLMRRRDGTVLAALAIFDANHRFPGETTFTGMHIHNGAGGTNGPVTIDSGLRAGATVASDTGFGNIYRTTLVVTDAQIATLNGALTNPENHYMNLHTTVHPGGAVRSQLLPVNTGMPQVVTAVSAISDVTMRRVAPGGLMTIYGSNLAKVTGNLDGWQSERVPTSLNGTSVDIAGKAAAIMNVDPRYIVAQVPTDVTLGDVDVVVKNSNGPGNTVRVTTARVAPAVFFDLITNTGNRAVAYSGTTGAQITRDNPADAGSTVGVFMTGMGISDPAQSTGDVAGAGQRYTGVRVVVGGRESNSVAANLIPGYVGFSQIVFAIPSGLTGQQTLEVEYQSAAANRTLLYLR